MKKIFRLILRLFSRKSESGKLERDAIELAKNWERVERDVNDAIERVRRGNVDIQ